jgi:alpha-aminoadipate carrier protein LysW
MEKVNSMVECTECGYEIELKSAEVGEIVDCPDCGMELEVVGLSPPKLAPAPQEQEDWGE